MVVPAAISRDFFSEHKIYKLRTNLLWLARSCMQLKKHSQLLMLIWWKSCSNFTRFQYKINNNYCISFSVLSNQEQIWLLICLDWPGRSMQLKKHSQRLMLIRWKFDTHNCPSCINFTRFFKNYKNYSYCFLLRSIKSRTNLTLICLDWPGRACSKKSTVNY